MARPRKPEALKVGPPRPCRTNFAQPNLPPGSPPLPSGLSPLARLAWDDVCATLARVGVLSDCDGLAVEGLCEAYADLRTARAALKARGGLTYEIPSEHGVLLRAYPEVAMRSEADKRFRAWLAAFGLAPADRSRVSVSQRSGGEDFSEFLN